MFEGRLYNTLRGNFYFEIPGFYHKPAWIWAYNSKGQILVQKRAMSKKRFPGYWDMPCTVHVDAGETTKIGAIREAKEEIGVDVSEEEMNFWFEYIEDDAWEIGQVFLFKCDKEIKELAIQEEVKEVRWLSFKEFKKLLYSDKWMPMGKAYKDLVVEKFEEILNGSEIK